mmetsp:Transcript_71760/g.145213  ORF Transcript_71760/g.145213 Transcript_71760/m.145213 type:complete len:207 (-) Transcript_71760:122-742(-)
MSAGLRQRGFQSLLSCLQVPFTDHSGAGKVPLHRGLGFEDPGVERTLRQNMHTLQPPSTAMTQVTAEQQRETAQDGDGRPHHDAPFRRPPRMPFRLNAFHLFGRGGRCEARGRALGWNQISAAIVSNGFHTHHIRSQLLQINALPCFRKTGVVDDAWWFSIDETPVLWTGPAVAAVVGEASLAILRKACAAYSTDCAAWHLCSAAA